MSATRKDRMSKGEIIPWNKGRTGLQKPTEETKKKMSESRGIKNPNYGKKFSEQHIKKLSESKKGRTVWNTGKKLGPLSEETKRKQSEALSGEKGPSWIDGRSYFPYCVKFNKRLKEKIRKRDNRTCQLCGTKENENCRKLDVHHVHYDKENCAPDLISLCQKCNILVNISRDYYENLFMEKLKGRGLLI